MDRPAYKMRYALMDRFHMEVFIDRATRKIVVRTNALVHPHNEIILDSVKAFYEWCDHTELATMIYNHVGMPAIDRDV